MLIPKIKLVSQPDSEDAKEVLDINGTMSQVPGIILAENQTEWLRINILFAMIVKCL